MPGCLFCKIIRKELKSNIEYEDETLIAIHDINPQAPVHLLFIPKKHVAQISTMSSEDSVLAGRLLYKVKEIAEKRGWQHYRLVFNNGAEAGQSVFHIHLHLLSGRRMQWPPG